MKHCIKYRIQGISCNYREKNNMLIDELLLLKLLLLPKEKTSKNKSRKNQFRRETYRDDTERQHFLWCKKGKTRVWESENT